MTRQVFALALLILGTACATYDPSTLGVSQPGSMRSYTQVGLHPHHRSHFITSANCIYNGFIPRCTEVEFVKVGTDWTDFVLVSNPETVYEYEHHSAAGTTFHEHMKIVFGPTCDDAVVSAMSEVDQNGIGAGVVTEGMTKEGVLLALGPPPKQATPDLASNRWLYWRATFDRFLVVFDTDGVVRDVID